MRLILLKPIQLFKNPNLHKAEQTFLNFANLRKISLLSA